MTDKPILSKPEPMVDLKLHVDYWMPLPDGTVERLYAKEHVMDERGAKKVDIATRQYVYKELQHKVPVSQARRLLDLGLATRMDPLPGEAA